ncbi:MAG: hypothetical protein ACE5FA_06555, partial [Dehalococcoidia bacterium]
MREPLAGIACPEVVIGLLCHPPAEPTDAWLYGGAADQHLAMCSQQDDRSYRIAWPVSRASLQELLEAAISIEQPFVTDGFSLSLDKDGFEALVSLIDVTQEAALRAALNRKPPPVPRFDAAGLFEGAQRSLGRMDLRWMAQRALLVAPARFSPSIEGIQRGLRSLARQGMLVQRNGALSSTRRFHTACTLLSGTTGFCSVATHRRIGEPSRGSPAWGREHLAALRGTGSLWLLEFSKITARGYVVQLGDVTADLLSQRLAASTLP